MHPCLDCDQLSLTKPRYFESHGHLLTMFYLKLLSLVETDYLSQYLLKGFRFVCQRFTTHVTAPTVVPSAVPRDDTCPVIVSSIIRAIVGQLYLFKWLYIHCNYLSCLVVSFSVQHALYLKSKCQLLENEWRICVPVLRLGYIINRNSCRPALGLAFLWQLKNTDFNYQHILYISVNNSVHHNLKLHSTSANNCN